MLTNHIWGTIIISSRLWSRSTDPDCKSISTTLISFFFSPQILCFLSLISFLLASDVCERLCLHLLPAHSALLVSATLIPDPAAPPPTTHPTTSPPPQASLRCVIEASRPVIRPAALTKEVTAVCLLSRLVCLTSRLSRLSRVSAGLGRAPKTRE